MLFSHPYSHLAVNAKLDQPILLTIADEIDNERAKAQQQGEEKAMKHMTPRRRAWYKRINKR